MGIYFSSTKHKTLRAYEACMHAREEHSAGFILYRMEKSTPLYLLLQYAFKSRFWDFVKGKIEKDESPEQAAQRECEEETGITSITPHPGFRASIEYWFQKESAKVHKRVDFLLARTRTAKVVLTEHVAYAWLPYKEAMERLTFKTAKDVLRQAHKHVQKHP